MARRLRPDRAAFLRPAHGRRRGWLQRNSGGCAQPRHRRRVSRHDGTSIRRQSPARRGADSIRPTQNPPALHDRQPARKNPVLLAVAGARRSRARGNEPAMGQLRVVVRSGRRRADTVPRLGNCRQSSAAWRRLPARSCRLQAQPGVPVGLGAGSVRTCTAAAAHPKRTVDRLAAADRETLFAPAAAAVVVFCGMALFVAVALLIPFLVSLVLRQFVAEQTWVRIENISSLVFLAMIVFVWLIVPV